MPLPQRSANHTAQGIACGMGAGALWGLVFLAPALARAFSPLEMAVGRYLAYGALSALLIGRPHCTQVIQTTFRRSPFFAQSRSDMLAILMKVTRATQSPEQRAIRFRRARIVAMSERNERLKRALSVEQARLEAQPAPARCGRIPRCGARRGGHARHEPP